MLFGKIKHFFQYGIWRAPRKETSAPVRILMDLLRRLFLSGRFFIGYGHMDYATALAFSTMLAIVPIGAMIFAIANGFGLGVYIEQWVKEIFVAQPQVAEWVIKMSHSYLSHTSTGVVIGIGILFMLYSILSLIYNVESVFDMIWQVRRKRSMGRMILGYTSMLIVVPIVIILICGVNIFVYTIVDSLKGYMLLGTVTRVVIKLLPLILMTLAFMALFVLTPSTKVKIRSAFGPSLFAAIAITILQFFYVNSQMFFSSYNAIYGSFAALPLFMLWMMIAWYICLFCCELCYTNQNLDYYIYLVRTQDISKYNQLQMAAILLSHICQRFKTGRKAYTALDLRSMTGIPMRIVTDLLYEMRQTGLVEGNNGDDGDEEMRYSPKQDIANLTLGGLIERLQEYPHNHILMHDINLPAQMNEHTRKRMVELRKQYLDGLKEISMTEVSKC